MNSCTKTLKEYYEESFPGYLQEWNFLGPSINIMFNAEDCRRHLLCVEKGSYLWKDVNMYIENKPFERKTADVEDVTGNVEITVGWSGRCTAGFWESLNFNRCTEIISEIYDLFISVLGKTKTMIRKLYIYIISDKDQPIGVSTNITEDFTEYEIVLNLKYIFSYVNLITIFIHELTHVLVKPEFCHNFNTCLEINARILATSYYLVAEKDWNFNLFPEWNSLFVCEFIDLSSDFINRIHLL